MDAVNSQNREFQLDQRCNQQKFKALRNWWKILPAPKTLLVRSPLQNLVKKECKIKLKIFNNWIKTMLRRTNSHLMEEILFKHRLVSTLPNTLNNNHHSIRKIIIQIDLIIIKEDSSIMIIKVIIKVSLCKQTIRNWEAIIFNQKLTTLSHLQILVNSYWRKDPLVAFTLLRTMSIPTRSI